MEGPNQPPWHRFHTSEGDRHSGQHPAPARHGMGPPSPTQRGLVSLRRLPGGLGGRAAPAGKGPRYRRDPRSSPGPGAVRHAGCDALPRVRNRSNTTDGIWHSDERFFRRGGSGDWQQFFTEAEHLRYYHRINQLAPPDLLAWAHEGRRGYDPAN